MARGSSSPRFGLARYVPLIAALFFQGWAQSEEDVDSMVDNETDMDPSRNIALGSARKSALKAWLSSLVVPIPAGQSGSLPMNMGNLTLMGGSCWDLRIGSLSSKDMSNGTTLHFELAVTDFEITCHVLANSSGDLDINITVGKSSIDLAVRFEPTTSMLAPEYPLPLGPMNLTACSADLVVSQAAFSGTSDIVMATSYIPSEMLASMIGGFINDPLCQGLKDFIGVKGTEGSQMGLGIVGSLLMDPWPLTEPEPLKEVVDWDHYPPMQVIQAMLRERFNVWTDRVLSIMSLRTFRVPVAKQDNFTIVVTDFQMEGVGPKSHPGLQLLAEDGHIQVKTDLHSLSMRTTLGVEVTLPNEPVLHEYINLHLGLDNATIGVRALVDAGKLDSLEMDQVMESPQCMIECMSGVTEPASEALAITQMQIGLRPLFKIASPGSLEVSIATFVNSILAALFAGYLPSMNRLLNGALAMARHPINSLIWKKLGAQPPCSRTNMRMGVEEGTIEFLYTTAFIIVGVGLVVAFVTQFFRVNLTPRKHYAAREQAPSAATVTAAEGAAGAEAPAAAAPAAPATTTSPCTERRLAGEPTVSTFLALFYPFAVVGAAFLFMFSDLDVGATVSINTRANGSEASVGPLFSFSLLSTVVHSWHSGAYFISIITLATSGIWPFVKLSLLLVCWLAPPRHFSKKARGRVLSFLDNWGKYSYVDSWFLVLSMSAFALDWHGVGNTSMKVQTVPTAAFYAYFSATSVSICLGLIASHQNSKAMQRAKDESDPEGTQALRMATELAKPERLCRLIQSKRIRTVVTAGVAVTFLLALLGIFLVSFTFGASGVAMEMLFGDHVVKSYSLWNVGATVAKGRYDEVALLGLEVVFIGLAVVAPVIEIAALGALWGAPLKIPGQQKLYKFCHVLDSWSSLDVAVVVLVISCFEFGRMAEFLVQKSGFAEGCNLIKDITQEDCFAVEMHAKPAMIILCFAGFLMLIVPKVMLRLTSELLEKRVAGLTEGKVVKDGTPSRFSKLFGLDDVSTAATGLENESSQETSV